MKYGTSMKKGANMYFLQRSEHRQYVDIFNFLLQTLF